ncbi:hypothetical protein LTR62_000672 [Meristemomyces frigidus]|uniref:Uncharacterized protein n=1 Tax=Meristemomyces frigidus TaxID=1508187 RepID=A0AAN7YGR0_9PEZI|nr:hypothetical protein LTR62_000672 [Meristemomyces frigidus]
MPHSRFPPARRESVVSEQQQTAPDETLPEGSANPNAGQRKKPKRAELTRNACNRCRQAKAKRLDARTRDYEQLRAVLLRLQQGSDNDAAGLLARLRVGETVEQVAGDPSFAPEQTFSAIHQVQDPLHRSESRAPAPDQQGYPAMESYGSPTTGSSPAISSTSGPQLRQVYTETYSSYNMLVAPAPVEASDLSTPNPYENQPNNQIDPNLRVLPQTPFGTGTATADVTASRHSGPSSAYGHAQGPILAPRSSPSIPQAHQQYQNRQQQSMPAPDSSTWRINTQGNQQPSSHNYDLTSFLWPCNTGDGMPGIDPQYAVRKPGNDA